MTDYPRILIATLGQEPQVITLALDALLRQGIVVQRVIVVHTNPGYPPLGQALAELIHEFEVNGTYKGRVMFSHEAITDENGLLWDVATSAEIQAAYAWLYQLIRQYKRTGAQVHLSIAGGRKTLGLFAFSIAQLLFDQDDHVWHLYSDETLRKSRNFHADNDNQVQLVDIPFIQWSDLPGTVRGEILGEGVQEAVSKQVELQHQRGKSQSREFIQQLTPAELDLLRLLVRFGGTNKALGEQLHKSPKTIANQLASIYEKFAVFYALPQERVDRSQLIASLGNVL